jgi:hypothetical protein
VLDDDDDDDDYEDMRVSRPDWAKASMNIVTGTELGELMELLVF